MIEKKFENHLVWRIIQRGLTRGGSVLKGAILPMAVRFSYIELRPADSG